MRFLDRFLRDESGALTVEFVLWVPVIAALTLIVIDAATIYITHTEMTTVARDTARRMVTGAVMSHDEAKQYASDVMNLREYYTYDIDTGYDLDTGAEVIIRFNVADMSILGYTSPMTMFGGTMAAHVIMRVDPNIPFGSSP